MSMARFAAFESFVLDRMVETKLPGLSFGLIEDGGVVHQRGLGFRAIESRLPTTPATLFGLGSVTKVFTALAIMQLQEQGLLSLDDPLEAHLPARLSRFEEPVRLWHLLSHSSGLPGLGLSETKMSERWFMTGYPVADGDDLMAFLHGAEAWAHCPPGERWFYLNEGYMLLGGLIEKRTGQPYMEYLRDHILHPLGMARTFWNAEHIAADPDAATPYMLDRSGEHFRGANLLSHLPAAGGLVSNVEDMNRFLLMFLNGGVASGGTRIVSEASLSLMMTPKVPMPQEADLSVDGVEATPGPAAFFGNGLQIQEAFPGARVVAHGGGVMGGTTYIAFIPEQKAGVVVLSNGHGYPMGQIALAALATVLGQEPDQLPVLRRDHLMRRLTGRYEAFRGTIHAEVRGRGELLELCILFHHEDRIVPLIPVSLSESESRFFALTSGRRMTVEFLSDDGTMDLLYERYKFRRCE